MLEYRLSGIALWLRGQRSDREMADRDDSGYYEVQLNNKQLIAFFVGTLAIAVVVFLCGVMIGRGVRDATLAASQNEISSGISSDVEERSSSFRDAPQLDYAERLEGESVQQALQPVTSESPEMTLAQVAQKNTKPVNEEVNEALSVKELPENALLGYNKGVFTIQVVALKTEDAAHSLLSRLQQKNYRAYLEAGMDAGLHRVRVGRFETRAEAEKVVQKLRDEEKFRPYITQ